MRNHYNYTFDNATNTYNFTTQNNISYKIIFVVDETFSSISGEEIPNIFQLVIEKITDEMEPFDASVSKTIVQVIETFFRDIQNALLFICDAKDGRAALRHAIFDKWYKNSGNANHIIKIDNVIRIPISPVDNTTLYTSFLLLRNNPDFKKLTQLYNKLGDILNEDK